MVVRETLRSFASVRVEGSRAPAGSPPIRIMSRMAMVICVLNVRGVVVDFDRLQQCPRASFDHDSMIPQ
jgi:hypothetical protein